MNWLTPTTLTGLAAACGLLIVILYAFEVPRYAIAEPVRSIVQRVIGWVVRMSGLVVLLGSVAAAVAVLARQYLQWREAGVWLPQSGLNLLLEFTVPGPWYVAVANNEIAYRALASVNGAALLVALGAGVALITGVIARSLVFRGERVWRRAADARRLREVTRKAARNLDPIDYPGAGGDDGRRRAQRAA